MKKLLLTSAILASSLCAFAQTPVAPNGGFENWSEGNCADEVPTGYEISADEFEECPTSSGVTKSTNKYSGTHALLLSSVIDNGVRFGNIVAILDDFDGRPTKLTGYTKFTKAGTDELNIFVTIIGAEEEEIGFGEVIITATQADYTKFEITLEYDESITAEPTSVEIAFLLGTLDGEQLTSSDNTVALIDAFSFEYDDTPTSTVNYSSASPINVYAANKNINFSENVSDVHVVDMVGANKIHESSATKTLNGASLNSGLYIVTYKYNDAYFSKKVVIE